MIICGDSLEVLDMLPRAKCIFADIPDNIGLAYNGFVDKVSNYYGWIATLLLKATPKCDIFWLSYNSIHTLEINNLLRIHLKCNPAWMYMPIIWQYTFSQYNANDFASGFRHIARLKLPNVKTYPETIRVESRRMELGDKRAAGPRVPDSVWEYPRIVGNSPERRAWIPTQHPENLMERIIRFSCSSQELFVDLFLGSGTTGRVCKRTGHKWIGVEISPFYCEKVSQELGCSVS